MKIIPFTLSHSEEIELKNIVKFDTNWRIRERVSTLLLFAQGLSGVKGEKKLN